MPDEATCHALVLKYVFIPTWGSAHALDVLVRHADLDQQPDASMRDGAQRIA
jgi:hypothetical protein